jgi:hypothetical protein
MRTKVSRRRQAKSPAFENRKGWGKPQFVAVQTAKGWASLPKRLSPSTARAGFRVRTVGRCSFLAHQR